AEPFMRILAAQLLVHPRVVDHVIPVHTAWRRLQIGRAVHMRNTQPMQIIRNPGRVFKGEPFVQLQPVARCRYLRHVFPGTWFWQAEKGGRSRATPATTSLKLGPMRRKPRRHNLPRSYVLVREPPPIAGLLRKFSTCL